MYIISFPFAIQKFRQQKEIVDKKKRITNKKSISSDIYFYRSKIHIIKYI